MGKRTCFISIVSLSVLVSASRCFPSLSDSFEWAKVYERLGQYEQAERVYKRIATEQRGTDNALNAQEQLTLLYNVWGNEPETQKALKDLIAAFSTHKDIAATIWRTARDFKKAGNPNKALDLHQYNVEHFPKEKHAMWSQVEIVYYHIGIGDFTAAGTGVDKLLEVFAAQPTLSKEIYQVTQKYEKAGRVERALQLYQYNVEHFPDDMYGLLSKVYYHLRNAEYEATDTLVNRLLTEFSGQPALAKEIYHLTAPFAKARKFETCVRLYNYFLDKRPKDEQAIFARKGLALCYIELGDESAAERAVQMLLSGFAGHKRIAEAVYDLGMHCYRSRKFHRARALHRYNVEHFPKQKYAMWSQVEMIKSCIRGGYLQAADALYEKLLSTFVLQPTLATEICRVADTYLAAGNLDKAQKLYTYVLDRSPDNQQILWAKAGKIKLDIARGDETTVQADMDNLVADFNKHPGLPEAVFSIGEQYRNLALSERRKAGPGKGLTDKAMNQYNKALAVWERIIKELPSSIITARAYHMAAECYRNLGQYDKMVQYCDELLKNWPDYGYPGQIQYMVGHTYEYLKRSGLIPASEAEPKIKAAYEEILQKHPGSPAARAARTWLRYNVELDKGEQK